VNAVTQMERLGYVFTLDGDSIRFRLTGAQPDGGQVDALLAELLVHKSDALAFLRQRQLPQRIQPNELGRYAHVLTPEAWRAYYRLD
jgi:hypothetical protein